MKKFFTVEDVKQMKIGDESLISALKQALSSGDEDIEETSFAHNGISYALCEIGQDDEIDEGKYTNGCKYYQLESFDSSEITYPCGKNMLDKFNIGVQQGYSKSGSYYSDYQWYYDSPCLVIISTKIVPEVVIPVHEEVSITHMV